MKDIDFDELDKAVNSLMGTAASPTIAKDEAQSVPVSPKEDVPVVTSAPASTGAPSSSVPPPTPAARPVMPAQRRSGRFMDMVHTSSDMTSSRPSPAPSREGLSVAPRSQTGQPMPAVEVTAEAASSSTSAPAWPDPLELASSQPSAEPAPEAEPEPSPAPAVAPTEPEPSAQSLDSPFLTDAKVEKRPLNPGASADEAPAEEPVVPTDADETPKPFVPAELNSDLVAIESGEPKNDAPAEANPIAKTETAVPSTPSGPSSIAQQYREEPNSGDQSHAAIYDTSQFQAPLSHPAKKKSGWLWVVWVVLLLALGAGGAIALYMADLI